MTRMKYSSTVSSAILVVVVAVTTSVLASPLPQQTADRDVYTAFSPGQYAQDGQAVYRQTPRLVAVRAGSPVLRAVPGGTLKRVRVVPATPVQAGSYELDQPGVSVYRTGIAAQPVAQPQQTYYVQRQPTAVHRPVAKAQPRPAYSSQSQNQEEPEEYPADPNPQYNFSFDVKDDDLTNYQNRQEERDGNVIKGSYSVVDPDGFVRTVTYTADSKNGFQAKVVREPTDVKIKFPVPTEAPDAQHDLFKHGKPSHRAQQLAHFPQTQQKYQQVQPQPQVYSQPAYSQAAPTYVVRRVPVASSANQPRVVKVLRAQ